MKITPNNNNNNNNNLINDNKLKRKPENEPNKVNKKQKKSKPDTYYITKAIKAATKYTNSQKTHKITEYIENIPNIIKKANTYTTVADIFFKNGKKEIVFRDGKSFLQKAIEITPEHTESKLAGIIDTIKNNTKFKKNQYLQEYKQELEKIIQNSFKENGKEKKKEEIFLKNIAPNIFN